VNTSFPGRRAPWASPLLATIAAGGGFTSPSPRAGIIALAGAAGGPAPNLACLWIPSISTRRRRAVAERWDLNDEVVLVGAGEPIHIPGRADRT
jgi:hypothetical protein